MSESNNLWDNFRNIFGNTGMGTGVYAAPGRVNLIGEHTDYNDGFVLPMAISHKMLMLAQLRDDRVVSAYSLDYDSKINFNLDDVVFDKENMWINYLKGVIDQLQKRGSKLQGINILFTGNIPQGSGLSSSAALEVVTAYTLADLNSLDISPVEMALLCQRAENNFVGVNCGIMDQYISRLGQKDQVLLIDCRTNEYETVPFTKPEYKVVICNSKVERGLVDSEYNQRREECNRATEYFSRVLNHEVLALRDVSKEEFAEYKHNLEIETRKRARHIITENNRVQESQSALQNNDFDKFGKLMVKSHESLRDDYEVSCEELDVLVELALQEEGVYGARMTGAGFGGCTVNLVKADCVAKFTAAIASGYKEKTGLKPEIYVSRPAAGARKLN